jgi:hypothetical protein
MSFAPIRVTMPSHSQWKTWRDRATRSGGVVSVRFVL